MVKCPSCGSENPAHVAFCGICGEPIPLYLQRAEERGVHIPAPSNQESSGEQLPTKRCNWCGESNKWSVNFCTNCGKDPHAQPVSSRYPSERFAVGSRPQSGLPVAGGILALVAGVLDVAMGLSLLAVGSVSISPDLFVFGSCCGVLAIIFGVVAFIGGVYATQRKSFVHAFVGALVGIFGYGFLIGAIFSFIGFVLIAVSRAEFE